MAAITKGSGSTLQADTVEGQLLELAEFIQAAELDANKNPDNYDYFLIEFQNQAREVSVTFNHPIQFAQQAGGGQILTAQEFLSNITFTAGSGGTIEADSTLGYWLDLTRYAQQLEGVLGTGTPNRIGGTVNIDTNRFSGTLTLPINRTIQASGEILITPNEFLST